MLWLTSPAAMQAFAADSSQPTLVVYTAEGCPHCAAAKAFLTAQQQARPALRVRYREVTQDPDAAEDLNRISREAGVWPPGVPTFVRGAAVMVGFSEDAIGQRQLLTFIEQGTIAEGTVETAWFGTLTAERLGLPLFTLALGLLDGFNPCAMWVLLFLLSLLVRLRDRRRMALIAGTFVAVSGIIYYVFMAAWLNVFLAVGMTDGIRWTLVAFALLIGAVNVKDFFAFGRGVSFSIPDAAKPSIYARVRAVLNAPTLSLSLVTVAALAIVVNFVELLCTAGLPALYTAVLTQHEVSAAGRYAYLALYIAGYIADDTLMVTVAVIALGQRKLTEATGRWLKLASGAVMIGLGAVLALRPHWLM
ncbi:MAG: glutaredoxin family protein [Gammaproteobacteria bacterium]